MNATNSAFDLLKQMKGVTPSQVTAHIQATASAKAMIASTAAMPEDPTLLGLEDGDEYIDTIKLTVPGTKTTVSLSDLASFAIGRQNIHLHGAAGTGKSRLSREVVKLMNKETITSNRAIFEANKDRVKVDGDKAKLESYARLPYMPFPYSCHEETVSDELLVSLDLEYDEKGNRRTVQRYGALISAWSKELGGGVCLLDECDAPIPGRMLVAHTLLDGQTKVWKSYVMGEKVFTKYDNFVCIATSNTRGAGENSRQFAGTQIQNGAFMSRFALSLEVGYLDYKTEFDFLTKSNGVSHDIAERMLEIAEKIRKSPSLDAGLSIRDLRNWAINANVWMKKKGIQGNGQFQGLWDKVYLPMAVVSFITRQADESTRDAMGQFLGLL